MLKSDNVSDRLKQWNLTYCQKAFNMTGWFKSYILLYRLYQLYHEISLDVQGLHWCKWYKIVKPCLSPVRKIIHSLKLVDYLHVQADLLHIMRPDCLAKYINMTHCLSSCTSFVWLKSCNSTVLLNPCYSTDWTRIMWQTCWNHGTCTWLTG